MLLHVPVSLDFSRAPWQPDQLGLALAGLIVELFLAQGEPGTVAIDDTLLQRWGRKVYGCFYHHDATANSEKTAVAWGNNWVVVGICVTLPFLERTVCLPVLFRLWRPPRRVRQDRQARSRPAGQARDGTGDDRSARRPPARPSDRCRRRRRVRHRGVARTAWSGDGNLPPARKRRDLPVCRSWVISMTPRSAARMRRRGDRRAIRGGCRSLRLLTPRCFRSPFAVIVTLPAPSWAMILTG
jgi:hypothetical protein